MKNRILILLIILSAQINAQSNSAWKKTLIKPDLLVYFIEKPKKSVDSTGTTYELKTNEIILKITSEKSPLNYNVRELIYTDNINSKTCTVTLQILNVTGFDEAMYKFYFIDFKNRASVPEEYINFFSDWDLYYKLENEIKNSENENKILEEKGFIIDGKKK